MSVSIACDPSRTDAAGRAEESAPLLTPRSAHRSAKNDGSSASFRALGALGALACCGLIAVSIGASQAYFFVRASPHLARATLRPVSRGISPRTAPHLRVLQAPSASADFIAHASSLPIVTGGVSDLSLAPLGNQKVKSESSLASTSKECSSPVSDAAVAAGLSTYPSPEDCRLLLVCAGSPRAGSTAQCTIARGVLDLIGYGEKSAGRSFSGLLREEQVNVDYWNFHLHTLCSDGVDCASKYPANPLKDATEWRTYTDSIEDKKIHADMDNAMRMFEGALEALNTVTGDSIVALKSHEFDESLMNVCKKRVVLTISRDKEEVYESAHDLKWFQGPDARDYFERYHTQWSHWADCWRSAATLSPNSTKLIDMEYESLGHAKSFKKQVRRIAVTLGAMLGIEKEQLDLTWISEEMVKRFFHTELNTELNRGTLPPKST